MKATHPLAGAFFVLAATVILALTLSYNNSREAGTRVRQPMLAASDAGPAFAQRGHRLRVSAAGPLLTANAGRSRYGVEAVTVALAD